MSLPETEFEWKIPKSSIGIERDHARTSFQAYAAECALHFAEKAHRMADMDQNYERCDLAVEKDAARLAQSHAQVKQIFAGTVCHLEAAMIQNPLDGWNLNELDFLFIENVGNLVCPSSYDLGADLRFVLVSVTEGEDKPLKYLTIFNSADVAVITKSDLAAAEFDEGAARANIVYFILVFYYIKDRKTLIPFQIVNILRSRVAATMHLSFSRVSGNLYPRNIKWLLETVSL